MKFFGGGWTDTTIKSLSDSVGIDGSERGSETTVGRERVVETGTGVERVRTGGNTVRIVTVFLFGSEEDEDEQLEQEVDDKEASIPVGIYVSLSSSSAGAFVLPDPVGLEVVSEPPDWFNPPELRVRPV